MAGMEIRTAVAGDVPGLQAVYPGDHEVVAVDGGRAQGTARSTEYRPKSGYAATRETSVYLADSASGRVVGTFREVGHKLGRWVDVLWFQKILG